MKRSLQAVNLIIPLVFFCTLLGCSPEMSPWLLDRTTPQPHYIDWSPHPPLHDATWSLGNIGLDRALNAYQQANYSEARSEFLRAALNTDSKSVLDRAMLGAVLSGLLSAEDMDEIQVHLEDFDHLAPRLEAGVVPLAPDLLRPFLHFVLAIYKEQQDIQQLRAESSEKSRRISSMRDEAATLRQQVEELEALFQLLEERKRQPNLPGVIN